MPVLALNREPVDATFEQVFPETVAKVGNASNAQGWWAGRAAADQASIGIAAQVADVQQERAAS